MLLAGGLALSAALGCADERDATPRGSGAAAAPPGPLTTTTLPSRLRVEVLEQLPHDPAAFTQGLELVDGRLYESTGLYGRSTLREVELATGRVLREVRLPGRLFGEGVTAVGDHLVQLTWREGVMLVWDRETFELVDEVAMEGEGWGLCHDRPAGRLVQSDGTATLRFRDPVTLAVTGAVEVTEAGLPVAALNELECDEELGVVWANVFLTEQLVAIDADTGEVRARVDATGLRPEGAGPHEVLNGIAALGEGRYLLTGKSWPTAHVVRFTAAAG